MSTSESAVNRFSPRYFAIWAVVLVLIAGLFTLGAVNSDDMAGRVAAGVAAVVALALAAMVVLAIARVRRARRDPDSAEAKRLDEFARTLPPSPSGRERAAWLALVAAFAVLFIVDRTVALSGPLDVIVDVARAAVFLALVATATAQLVRHRRWRRERASEA